MRTTVTLDDQLMKIAAELTGIEERSELIRHAVTTLIQLESGRRLAALGGKDKPASAPPRRRPRK
ncbi:MAG: type II toxin-antitoxin system VapB family antitoxin [Betaproteobacteria bacterium]